MLDLPDTLPVTRRSLLGSLSAAAFALIAANPRMGWAQAVDPKAPQPFSFDILSEEMRVLSQQPQRAVALSESFLNDLTYDDYKLIQFLPRRARWKGKDSAFRLHAFHMGWLFEQPVELFEVADGKARELVFSTDDYEYLGDLPSRVPSHTALPGVAGFRLNAPLNRPDLFDEVVAFVGASYFRALGRGNAYGLSARGLAINTGLPQGEEFPRFSRFYLERPAPWSKDVVVCAALESDSVTGAYRFVIRPGDETLIDVTARLFFRNKVEQLGIAPLTSMFLFSEKNRGHFDDYRPNVHDSDGLKIERADGDALWRPLNNPPRLTGSYFVEDSPKSFGLFQRDRDFDNYQDASAHYERRPSVSVEPVGAWGKGAVRLVEIPTDLEVNDNIVAFWVPDAPVAAGDAREFSYRLRWGALAPQPGDDLAHVHETRAGHGGVSGVANTDGTRKFVIDFKDGLLAALPDDAKVEAVTTVSDGKIVTSTLSKIPGTGVWRLVLDVSGAEGETVELGAHVSGYGQKMTETWLYQWIVS
ncbi:glucan biosynthesis protein [Pseudogemmobacter sp. W21_MBD1_M6]|uniref:glucan biosynthesis protein n=1 Tax=Pseudogemmobacter sp. W21_MBD1_M6 TaxID=3240271 RepID=UPI003F9AE983